MGDDWRFDIERWGYYFKPVIQLNQTDYDRWGELARERRKRHNAFNWMKGVSDVLSVALVSLIAMWIYPMFRSVFEPCGELVSRLGFLLFVGLLLLSMIATVKVDAKYLRPILTRWINRRHRSDEDIRMDQKAILVRYGVTDTFDIYIELKPHSD